MSEPTDREYELENELWNVMFILQQLKIAYATHDSKTLNEWMNRAGAKVLKWMQTPEWYMQHPKWDEVNEQHQPPAPPRS